MEKTSARLETLRERKRPKTRGTTVELVRATEKTNGTAFSKRAGEPDSARTHILLPRPAETLALLFCGGTATCAKAT
jgi:hypothetical protein